MSYWLPIETAPRDGTEVLGWGADFKRVVVMRYEYGGFATVGPVAWAVRPSHWQPLPTPPSEGE